jgi:hypothetical protein
MNSASTIIIAGICVMLVGAGALLFAGLRAKRTGAPMGTRLDVYMACVWTGMLMVQMSSIVLHWEPAAIYHLSPLTLSATAANIFVCGIFAGRLLLRREMRLQKERQELLSS